MALWKVRLKCFIISTLVACITGAFLYKHFIEGTAYMWHNDRMGAFTISYDVDCNYNNSVGNEWGYSVYIDNRKITSGEVLKLPLNTYLNIKLECKEYDAGTSDIGTNSLSFKLADDKSTSVTGSVITSETSGRFTGNTAQHTFTVEFKHYFDYNILLAAVIFIIVLLICLGKSHAVILDAKFKSKDKKE